VRIHVAFTPAETVGGRLGIVVDVIRATSTITQALAAGWPRVLCCAEIDEARALKRELGEGLLGGEREAVRIEGFDVGASPREFVEPRNEPLILSTTNGTRAILSAAAACEEVIVGSLLNLGAVAAAARSREGDVIIVCAGFKGSFALDDAYCAGRIAAELDGTPTDAAVAATCLAASFPDALAGLMARTYGPPGLEEDIAFCARENVLDVLPRFSGRVGPAAEIRLD
jgi:2-phosphosulfolactate phosphatase